MSLLKMLKAQLESAVANTWQERRFAYASPVFAFPAAYVLAYGLGALLYADRMGDRAPVFAVAAVIGLIAFFVGVAFAWRPSEVPAASREARLVSPYVLLAASVLVLSGLLASVAYLFAIGGIPLLMPSVEEARVAAAERGGAPLRVTALLALPGVWVITAWAGATRRPLTIGLALASVVLVAGTHLLTANRAPAFLTVEVALLVALLAAGLWRIPVLGLAALAAAVISLVLLAGVVGGYRLGQTPATWRDPEVARSVATGNLAGLTAEAVGNYLVVPIQNFASTLNAVPERIGWRFGYTYLQPVLTALPGHQTTFDQDLKAALAQEYSGGGTVPSMLGEAYANFGPLGWIFVPGLVGAILTYLYRTAVRLRTLSATTLYAFALVHAASATISGLAVANIFPYVALAILGLGTILEALAVRRMRLG